MSLLMAKSQTLSDSVVALEEGVLRAHAGEPALVLSETGNRGFNSWFPFILQLAESGFCKLGLYLLTVNLIQPRAT